MMNLYCFTNFSEMPIDVTFYGRDYTLHFNYDDMQKIRDMFSDEYNILDIELRTSCVVLCLIKKEDMRHITNGGF